jgi:predicted homoserine dehydrogenase-like protein
LLPLGLASGVQLRRPIAAGAAITYDDVDPGTSPSWTLRRQQDQRIWG